LTPLRAELLRGDRRVAYVAWLLAAQAGELDPDTSEPRAPHGLYASSASLAALTSFLRVDPDLLAAAAAAGVEDTGELDRFRSWVAWLPAPEQQRWLLRAVDNLDLAIGSALLGEFRRAHPSVAADQGRTVAQLLARAEERRAERRRESLRQGQTSTRPPASLEGLTVLDHLANATVEQQPAGEGRHLQRTRRPGDRASGAFDAGILNASFFTTLMVTAVVISGSAATDAGSTRVGERFGPRPPTVGTSSLLRQRRQGLAPFDLGSSTNASPLARSPVGSEGRP
jgi:hypothetical protein